MTGAVTVLFAAFFAPCATAGDPENGGPLEWKGAEFFVEADWKPFDADGDGRLNEQEFKAYEAAPNPADLVGGMKSVFAGQPERLWRLRELIGKFDGDGNGRWSEGEFRDFKKYDGDYGWLYDLDGSGRMDSKEKRIRNEELAELERIYRERRDLS